MQPGVHYLPYNTTIESLIEVIKNNTGAENLESISAAASKLIQNTMHPDQLKQLFFTTLLNL